MSEPSTLQLLITLGFIFLSSAGSVFAMIFIVQIILRHVPPDHEKIARQLEAQKRKQQAAILPDHLVLLEKKSVRERLVEIEAAKLRQDAS